MKRASAGASTQRVMVGIRPTTTLPAEADAVPLHGGGGLGVGVEQLDAVAVVAVAGGRRHHAAAVAREQLGAQGVLQLAHVLRHARLGGVLAPGRSREGALLVGCHEQADVAQAGVHRCANLNL